MVLALALTVACGGDGDTTEPPPQASVTPSASPSASASASPAASAQPSGTVGAASWAAFRQVIERFVPESTQFKAFIPRVTDPDRPDVDITMSPAFVSGRLHLIPFSGRGETFFAQYEGFDLYKLGETPWAKLVDGQPPLWVGSPSEETLHRYLDFFVSRGPALTSDRFWNAFTYAEARIGAALGGDADVVQIQFDDAWNSGGLEAGGIRLEAAQGSRHACVGILYGPADSGADAATLAERLGEDFREQFGVPSGSAEESESREWGYPNHIWFVQWETAP